MTSRPADRLPWSWLAVIVVIGLALRIANAHGGLWLDEAWSAKFAHDVRTPLGVFFNINHDNNHHLNSLWLQFVGFDAPPLLDRALSIVTGTIAIPVAALIAAPRGRSAALVTAGLFAISPVFVLLGSEARGYAPMSLALLYAILLTDRWLAGKLADSPAIMLAICFLLGALAHLTILFGFCAIAGWVVCERWQRTGPGPALQFALRLLWPAAVVLAAVFALVLGAASASATGFQFGRYDPFALLNFLRALIDMIAAALGWTIVTPLVLFLPPLAVVMARSFGVARTWYYVFAVVVFPMMLVLLQVGNTRYPRYYLVLVIALLLLLGELGGRLLATRGVVRWTGVAMVAVIALPSLIIDGRMILNQRGDPTAAIRAMARRAPGGSAVLFDRPSGAAILEVAATQTHYPLTIVDSPCGDARFLFVERVASETFPDRDDRCGSTYRPIAHRDAYGLSGSNWTLYDRGP